MKSGKPRSDSKLDNLTPEQKIELRDGLLNGGLKSYEEALAWLRDECGVSSSPAALSTFYRRHCAPVVDARRRFASMRSEAVGNAIAKDPVKYDELVIEEIKQRFFELMSEPKLDLDAAKILWSIIKGDRDTRESMARLEAAAKTKTEAGIDALSEEAKGNKEAEAALAMFVAAIKKKGGLK